MTTGLIARTDNLYKVDFGSEPSTTQTLDKPGTIESIETTAHQVVQSASSEAATGEIHYSGETGRRRGEGMIPQLPSTFSGLPNEFFFLTNSAYDLIIDAIDDQRDIIERANCFEDWKEILLKLSFQSAEVNNRHRQILGALLNASNKLEFPDVSPDLLAQFRDSSYLLRQPRIGGNETKRKLEELVKQGATITNNLADSISDDSDWATIEQQILAEIEKE